MKKVIRLTEKDLNRIVKRVISEDKPYLRTNLGLRKKLDDIFFRDDEYNLSSDEGKRGYLSMDYMLDKEISPRQRMERIQQVIDELKDYINDLENTKRQDSESYRINPDYDSQWGEIETDM